MEICLSLVISLSFSFVTVSELFCCKFFETFDIPLLYYYNLSLSKISCLSSWDIYLPLGISSLCSFATVSELFCCECLETFVILLAILLPMKSPVVSAVF